MSKNCSTFVRNLGFYGQIPPKNGKNKRIINKKDIQNESIRIDQQNLRRRRGER